MDCATAQSPVTGDLRRWWEIHMQRMADADLREGFGNLCAAIDALHASLEAENRRLRSQLDEAWKIRNKAWNEGFDEGFASADDWLAEHEADMAEHGWVRLPLDANEEAIHVGDDMETLLVGFKGEHSPVEYIALTKDGWEVDGERPDSMIHHNPEPTVEDVLCELLDKVDDDRAGQAEIIAEYAAKLRLAGDAE